MSKRIQNYAKKTFLAMDNKFNSVKKVYPNSIDSISEEEGFYLGIKEVKTISDTFIAELKELGYVHHTVDKASLSGRAIDLDLKNPLTGHYMTGSSSGTALNVFLGINDLGVGTDGGGSVLGPAMSLNLYGFIHPKLGQNKEKKEEKKLSTDGIEFSPSIGLISDDLTHIESVVKNMLETKKIDNLSIGIDKSLDEEARILKQNKYKYNIEKIEINDKFSKERKDLITDLKMKFASFDIVISKEGPIDLKGFGDSVFGHFSNETKEMQQQANKGYIRVINMINGAALVVPNGKLAEGYVLMTEKVDLSEELIEIGKILSVDKDELVKRYFENLSMYFDMGI